MIKKIIEYVKYSMEPDEKQLKVEAMESAKKYFSQFQRYQISVSDWQQYQHAYKSAYRHTYAKNKMKAI